MPMKVEERKERALNTRTIVAVLVILCIPVVILLAKVAFDLLALLAFGAGLIALQRTVGDWLMDALGPVVGKAVLLGCALVTTLFLLALDPVRKEIWRGLESADRVGLHSLLLQHLEDRSWGGVSVGGGGGGTPPGTASSSGTVDDATGSSGKGDKSSEALSPTRLLFRVETLGNALVLQAQVIAEKRVVDEGSVEFTINNRKVASARVIAGRAEARIENLSRGSYSARARFFGDEQFRDSVAVLAFIR